MFSVHLFKEEVLAFASVVLYYFCNHNLVWCAVFGWITTTGDEQEFCLPGRQNGGVIYEDTGGWLVFGEEMMGIWTWIYHDTIPQADRPSRLMLSMRSHEFTM